MAVSVVQIVQSGAKWKLLPQWFCYSYVESSGTDLVNNHESLSRAIESQFKTSPLVLFCRQTPPLCITVYRNKNVLLLLSGTTKTKRNTHVWVVKQQSQEQPQKSHKQDFYKNIFWSNNRSLRPEGPNHKLFCIFGNFYASGTQNVRGKRITATPLTEFPAHLVSLCCLNYVNASGADPEFFLGGGALVSCSTSTPIIHIVFFFLAEYQLY